MACKLASVVLNVTSLTFSEKVEKLFSAVTVSGRGVYTTDGVGGLAGGASSSSPSWSVCLRRFSSPLAKLNRDNRSALCGLPLDADNFLLASIFFPLPRNDSFSAPGLCDFLESIRLRSAPSDLPSNSWR